MTTTTTVIKTPKSMVLAYVLLIIFGGLGIHRFYLGRTKSAIGMIAMLVIGWLTAIIVIGDIILVALGIWVIVDLFLIPGMVRASGGSTITVQTTTTTTHED